MVFCRSSTLYWQKIIQTIVSLVQRTITPKRNPILTQKDTEGAFLGGIRIIVIYDNKYER